MRIAKLNDIAELKTGPFGTQFSASEYVSEGIPVINVKNIGYGSIIETGLDHVSKNTLERLSEHKLKEGDIVFGRKGSVDRHCLIRREQNGWMQGSDCIRVRFTDTSVYSEFVSYYLLTDAVKMKINNSAVGSTMASLNTDILGDVDIILPDYAEQKSIAITLGIIDKKIKNNNRINDYLEEMAKTIYDYWFVQFDFPNENGEPYKSSGGEMMYSPKLDMEIPAFWEITTLRGHHNIERGISYTSKDISSGKGTPMINLACIDINRNYRDGQLKYYANDVSADKQLTGNELLIACTDLTRNADIVGSPILVPKIDQQMTFSMDMAKLEVDNCIFDKYYLYMTLRTKYYHNFIKKYASGTNVLHLNLDGLNWYTMWVPPLPLQSQFGHIIHKLQVYMNDILHENRQLYDLRDWLLPMLMNGQATIED